MSDEPIEESKGLVQSGSYLGFRNETTSRRNEVLYRLFNGIPLDDELAVKYGVSLTTLKNDERTLREWFRKQAAQSVAELSEKELAFAYDQRRICVDKVSEAMMSGGVRWMELALGWTRRISELMGLDAPSKNINLNLNYDAYAKEQGVDRHSLALGLIAETINIIKEVQLTPDELRPLFDALQSAQVVKDVTPESVSTTR